MVLRQCELMEGVVIMTKAAIKRELRNTKYELAWLLWREQQRNPDWRFTCTPYSKRRARLVKTYWALKAMQGAVQSNECFHGQLFQR